jgi:chitosanase
MLTTIQIKTAQSILNIFETCEMRGDFGNVPIMTGDAEHLTFECSQKTLGSESMHCYKYIKKWISWLGSMLMPKLRMIENNYKN